MEAAMDEQPSQAQGQDEQPPPPPPPPSVPESQPQGGEDVEEQEDEEAMNEDDELIAKAQKLMEKITSSPDNPNRSVLHALASLLETQDSRYMEENGYASNNGRASHNVGRLGNMIRDNDDFFELISSKYLSETRFHVSIQAAAARLILDCSLSWMYPHIFEEAVLENIKFWVMDESAVFSGDDQNWKHESGKNEASDSEMLKTYSSGLLAACLTGGGRVVEDVLTAGLPAKLMHYLRLRVLGETSHKGAGHITESKSGATRGRDENRSKVRRVLENSHFDGTRDDQIIERDERSICVKVFGEERPGGFAVEADVDGQYRWHARDLCDRRTKLADIDENGRDDSTRCRQSCGSRGKGRANEGPLDNDQILTSPGSGSQVVGQSHTSRDRSSIKHQDVKKLADTKMHLDSRGDNDDCFQDCRYGTKDISDLVKKAVRAAEAEARAANAPIAAIKAAGDAAAEVVKSAALEEFRTTNDEEAAILAASKAASTVIDAADAVEVSRSSININISTVSTSGIEAESIEDVEEYFIPDVESLAKMREKYCIRCLETLGEYVEVLGPVLNEKGVDVCLALLQQNSKHKEPSKVAMLLPDVMKLICALAAHRKFAALFVDRGGMEKLLAVPRVTQTFFGLSSCLFTIGSLQGIMERVCALPSEVVHQLVELSIQLLECSQDQARKNSALFFAAAFVFRAVLDAFDNQDGLQKLLGLLNDAASVRSGVNSAALGLSNSGILRNDRSLTEVLTSSEKQIAYHTCVSLRQYFRAHLLLLVDSIRPIKNNRSAARSIPSVRAAYKPLDISNEAIDAVLLQLQKDRKLGPAFVRTRWPAVEKFLASNGHVTLLELCQAPPVDRYLHDLLQYALGVLHIVTLVPSSRKMIVNATLSNNRVGIAVILDAASVAGSYVDPDIIQPALNVFVNLVCPPPSISNKPPLLSQNQQSSHTHASNGPFMENRDRNPDRTVFDRTLNLSGQNDPRDRGGESVAAAVGAPNYNNLPVPPPTPTSGLVGDRRISLGAGAGGAGLAAQLEQGYRQAREAVRANNGIKVLLHLLQPRIYSPPAALDCLRALACRVLLGLARDDAIAHILTKLQVGKKLSELIRDSGSQTQGTEQGRWQAELSQAAIELIAIVTNSGRASTIAATDAATPTLRRIERAAIAAATPITYHSRELLFLVHEHLQASGLGKTAVTLLEEAQLIPLPSLAAPSSLMHQNSTQEGPTVQLQWPSSRTPCGFLSHKSKLTAGNEEACSKDDLVVGSSKKRPIVFSPTLGLHLKNSSLSHDSHPPSVRKGCSASKESLALPNVVETPTGSLQKPNIDESKCKTPIVVSMKRKLSDFKDNGCLMSSAKRLRAGDQGFRTLVFPTPYSGRKSILQNDTIGFSTPISSLKDVHWQSTSNTCSSNYLDDNQYGNCYSGAFTPSSQFGFQNEPQNSNNERLTLDSLVVQYLKHQHRQCPAPITTLPPLSLLQPHICPEPRRSLDAPTNVTARLSTREFRSVCGGVHGHRKDRQFVYSRFRPWRSCRDDASSLFTCISFLHDSSRIAVGSQTGELRIFDSNSNSLLESCSSHPSSVTLVQSYLSGENQLVLSSSPLDVKLWDASALSGGPMHSFEGCRAARFNNCGDIFAALSSESAHREILLYDIQTCQVKTKLSDASSSTGRGHFYSLIHFNPLDTMVLWNGILWDTRVSTPVHRFDQFTDYGGGGFHPAGNEVIINSEVWDLRKFKLMRSVPSLDQTTITFNSRGDVIYAILRRNMEDVSSAAYHRRMKHPLFAGFRTLDAVNYSDIATIPVDRRVLDFATEPTDSFVGLITMDDHDEMFSSARVYEIGRRRPTDDDSDPDDAESEEDDEDDNDDDDGDMDSLLGDLDRSDGDSDDDDDDISGDDDDDSLSELDDDDDGDFIMDFGGGGGMLEIVTEGDDEDENDSQEVEFSSDDDDDVDFVGNGFGH